MDQRDFFRQVAGLTKEAKHEDALRLFRNALRRRQLDAEGVEKAGRLCRTAFEETKRKAAAKAIILGQCTTSWLANVLTAVAWGEGLALHVTEAPYDNVIQELLTPPDGVTQDVVVLVPWHGRLLSNDTSRQREERIHDECVLWRQAWQLSTERWGAKVLQVGYDWVTPGPYGHSLGSKDRGDIALVRGVNDELQRTVPQGAYFVHLEQVSGIMGRDRFYDPRRYAWTKQPFSEDGTVLLARHIWSGIRAMISGPKKVLVLDLDNTIWGGVVGETGPLGVELGEGPDGEAYRAFQTYVKKLTQRGVLLTVCSKNNDADAREPFEKNPSMVLALDDFAHFEASWDPKAAAIRRTADVLQLGLDSFVFFDDNPAEREHIRQLIDEVEVVEVPLDPSEYIRALEDGLWFEAVSLTGEDRVRVDQYHTERLRREAGVQFESIDAYLGSLNMTAEVRGVDDGEMDRVIQLIGKTNQFNLTTRRHSVSAVREMIDDPHTIALTLRVADRFGDYGLVSVLLATRDNGASVDALTIDTWLMSCRVINRTVEEFFFNYLVGEARRRGVRRLVGHFVPSSKNALVKDLYDRLGFVRRAARTGSCVVYDLDLDAAPLAKTMVCIAGAVSSDGAA